MNSALSTEETDLFLLKLEVAEDLGIKLGPDTSSKENGLVGIEMARRLRIRKKDNNKNRQ